MGHLELWITGLADRLTMEIEGKETNMTPVSPSATGRMPGSFTEMGHTGKEQVFD